MKFIARIGTVSAAFAALMVAASPNYAQATSPSHTDAATAHRTTTAKVADVSDAALVKSLPGFRNGYAEVNGVRLHYVVGGKGDPLVLLPGDYVGWRMTNLGKSDVAVSLLYIDAGFGIHAIYPRAGSGTDNMLTKNGGTHATAPAKITANPVGNEHVVLIAAPRQAGQQSPDFSFLEQQTLPKARGNGETGRPNAERGRGRQRHPDERSDTTVQAADTRPFCSAPLDNQWRRRPLCAERASVIDAPS